MLPIFAVHSVVDFTPHNNW